MAACGEKEERKEKEYVLTADFLKVFFILMLQSLRNKLLSYM